eukprot:3355078-Prymnesium_polylepis.1
MPFHVSPDFGRGTPCCGTPTRARSCARKRQRACPTPWRRVTAWRSARRPPCAATATASSSATSSAATQPRA